MDICFVYKYHRRPFSSLVPYCLYVADYTHWAPKIMSIVMFSSSTRRQNMRKKIHDENIRICFSVFYVD